MALPYASVRDLYDTLRSAGATSLSLPEWSAQMNQTVGNDNYAAGLSDNFIKQASYGIDQLLNATGLPDYAEGLGRQVGGWIGDEESGAAVGRSLPRAAVNFAPLALAAVPLPGAAGVGLGLSSALAGAESYTATGSPLSGLLTAGVTAAMPGAARFAEQGALRLLQGEGGRLAGTVLGPRGFQAVNEFVPTTFGQGAVSQLAGQGAAALLGEGQRGLEAGLDPEAEYDFSPTRALLEMTLGQLPFAGAYATSRGRTVLGGEASRNYRNQLIRDIEITKAKMNLAEMDREAAQTPPVAKPPPETDPLTRAKTERFLSELRTQTDARDTQMDALIKEAAPEKFDELENLRRMDDAISFDEGYRKALDEGKVEYVYNRPLEQVRKRRGIDPELNPDLPIGPEVVPDLVLQRKFKEAQDRIAGAKSTKDLADAVDDANQVLERLGMYKIQQSVIEAKRKELEGEQNPPTEAQIVQAVVNDAQRAATKEVSKQRTAGRRRQDAMDYVRQQEQYLKEQLDDEGNPLPGADEEFIAELNDLHGLKEAMTTGAVRGDELVVSGEIDRIYHEWVMRGRTGPNGQPVDFDLGVRSPVMNAKRTGKGLPGRVQKADVNALTTEQVLQQELVEYTDLAHERGFGEEWDEAVKGKDKATLRELMREIDETGEAVAPAPEGVEAQVQVLNKQLDELAPGWREMRLRDVPEAAFEPFVERQRLLRSGTDPDVVAAPAVVPRGNGLRDKTPFIPSTPEDVAWMQSYGQTGKTVLDRLIQSTDPRLQSGAQRLAQFFNAVENINVEYVNGRSEATVRNGIPTIRLSAKLRNVDPVVAEREVMHEFLHGLTLRELRNPINGAHVYALDKLREKAIAALPEKQRNFVKEIITNKGYERYARGEISFDELFANPKIDPRNREILYGFLNNDEFVSQAYSNEAMQNFLATNKGKTGLKEEFIRIVKSVLGLGPEKTLLDDFIFATDRILWDADSYARAQKLGAEKLESRGVLPELARTQSARALDLLVRKPDAETAFVDLYVSGQKSPLVRQAENNARRMFGQNGEDAETTNMFLQSEGLPPGMDGLISIAGEATTGNTTLQDTVRFLPEQALEYVLAMNQDFQQVVSTARWMTKEDVAGMVGYTHDNAVASTLKEIETATNKLREIDEDHQEGVRMARALYSQISPDGFLDTSVVAAPFGEAAKKTGEWLEWALKLPSDWGRTNPELAEVFSKGRQLQENGRRMYSESVKILGENLQTGQADPQAVQEVNQVFTSKKLLRAVDKWMGQNQIAAKKEGRGVTTLMSDDSRIAPILKDLTPAEQGLVGNVVARAQAITQNQHRLQLEKMEQLAAIEGAAIPLREGGKTAEQSVKLSRAVLDAITVDRTDTAAAMKADQMLNWARGEMSPEGFFALLEKHQRNAQKLNDHAEWFAQNPAWATAQRMEPFLVRFNVGKKPYKLQASSRKEALAKVEEFGGKLIEITDNTKALEEMPQLGMEGSAVMARLNELQENEIAMDLAAGHIDEEGAKFRRERSGVATQFGREQGATRGIPDFEPPARLLSQGAEDLPFMWNHMAWAQRQSNYWTRAQFRAEMELALNDPAIQANDRIRKVISDYRDNTLQNDPALAGKLRKFATSWFLGFAPASAMVNATQSFVTHVAEMTRMTGSIGQSYKRTLGAFNQMKDYYTSGRKWADPEVEWFMNEATKAGERSYSMWDEEAAINDSLANNTKRLMMKTKVQTVGQRAGTMADGLSKASLMMFKGIERLNNDAALLAGFEYFRKQKHEDGTPLTREEAKEQAFRYNQAVNFGGGKANRPVGLFSGRSPTLRTAAMFSTALQTYVLGTTAQLARYMKEGFFQPTGLTPHQKWAARKAAVQMLGTQFALAGTLGLPFVSSAIGLLEQAFPDAEINKNMREAIAQLLGEDDENGSPLQDIAMTGIPSMMGWDLQSRLSMGNTLPGTSEINGFQPQQLAGPIPTLLGSFVHGGLKAVQGQAPWEFIPPGLRKLAKAGAEGGVKDWKGRPTVGELTPDEGLGLALGFNPKRVSDLNAAGRVSERADRIANRKEGEWRQAQATEALKGNFGNVRLALQKRLQEEPNFDVGQAVRYITQAAEEYSFPKDLRQTGGRGTDSRLIGLFNLAQSGPSEMARLQFRQQLAQRLGLPMNLDTRDMQQAQMMDALRAQQPNSTRAELRRAVRLASRVEPQQGLPY